MNKSRYKKAIAHCKDRALQRYGVELTKADIHYLEQKIRREDSVFVATKSNRITVHDVTLNGISFRAAYDRVHGHIVTLLTPPHNRFEIIKGE